MGTSLAGKAALDPALRLHHPGRHPQPGSPPGWHPSRDCRSLHVGVTLRSGALTCVDAGRTAGALSRCALRCLTACSSRGRDDTSISTHSGTPSQHPLLRQGSAPGPAPRWQWRSTSLKRETRPHLRHLAGISPGDCRDSNSDSRQATHEPPSSATCGDAYCRTGITSAFPLRSADQQHLGAHH